MNLITDVFFFNNLKVIEESNVNGTMTLEGTFQRAAKPNQNKRIYPRTVLNTQVDRLQDLIESRRLCGELDHPKNETVKLANASHLVTKLWMEGDEVYGRAELLNTPAGKVAQTLVNDGVSIGISSRGLGTLSEAISSEGYKTVNDDYKLVTFDLVADPSTKGAYPTLSESVEHFNDTSRGELKDRTYITLLKQEINSRFEDNEINENMYKGYGKKKKKKGGVPGSPCLPSAKMSKRARPANEDVFDALEKNIRLFITENEDHELAAQFVLEHKDAIVHSLTAVLDETVREKLQKAKELGKKAILPAVLATGLGLGGVALHRSDAPLRARHAARMHQVDIERSGGPANLQPGKSYLRSTSAQDLVSRGGGGSSKGGSRIGNTPAGVDAEEEQRYQAMQQKKKKTSKKKASKKTSTRRSGR